MQHICAWMNYIKVVDLRKSDYRHNFKSVSAAQRLTVACGR